MQMPKAVAFIGASSLFPCCQIGQNPPGTTTQNSEKQKVEAGASDVVPDTRLILRDTAGRMVPRRVGIPPPHDRQSLLSTFLI